jgi:hypothetical protein
VKDEIVKGEDGWALALYFSVDYLVSAHLCLESNIPVFSTIPLGPFLVLNTKVIEVKLLGSW